MSSVAALHDGAVAASDLAKAFNVSRETLVALTKYAELLTRWQKAKNLVANSTLPDLWRRHFFDSMQLFPLLGRSEYRQILDIGSGAGFPGLVLAIAGAGHVHLVESNGRKGAFLREVIRTTGAPATVHTARIETLDPFDVDFVTSRACAKTAQLLDWSKPFLKTGSEALLLKGKTVDEELTDAARLWTMQVTKTASLTDRDGWVLHLTDISAAD